jgi:hypothetical protein
MSQHPATTRLERVADELAKVARDTALAFCAREQGCRVRDLDPVFCASLDVELQRAMRMHLPLAVEADAQRNTPVPGSDREREDQAQRDRLTRHHPPGERYTPHQPIDPEDLEASREATRFDDEVTRPGWRLPDGVARSSQRTTPVK